MSITDELRACARAFLGVWVDSASQTITFTTSDVPPTVDSIRMDSRLLAIADRIDKEHEEALQREHETAYDEGYDEGFASADDALSREENGVLEEHGFVRMPEDADGKYWFCGDKIMLPDGNVVEIIGIGGDWLYYCVASVAITVFGRIRAHDKRHYHAPTVEDVLREMLDKWGEMPSNMTNEAIVAEYAAKLQLKEGA